MIMHIDGGRWYIDVRATNTSDQLSYDLTHHLPRRIAAGTVFVATDNTKVFLSVIKKRWMKLLHDVECQRSSTLDPVKRSSLQYEADQMRGCFFASRLPEDVPDAQVYFLTPEQLNRQLPDYATLYITTTVAPHILQAATATLAGGGLVVIYGPWMPAYDELVKQAFTRNPLPNSEETKTR